MQSRIVSDTTNVDEHLDLTSDEAQQLRLNMDQLTAMAELEELYDLLVTDYLAFEAECLATALEYSAGRCRTIADLDDMRRRFNSRLMHVLTLARTYMDCTPKLMERALSSSAIRREIKRLFSQQYDSHLGFRVMEALRNSAQHHGLPLHNLQAGFVWIPSGDKRKGRVHSYSVPMVQVDAIARDPEFKKSVLVELQRIGPRFDIRPMVREYLECISKIQFVLRLEASEHLRSARHSVGAVIERWRKLRAEVSDYPDRANLYIVDFDAIDWPRNASPLNLRPCEISDELESRNPELSNLSISFVSNSTDEIGGIKAAEG